MKHTTSITALTLVAAAGFAQSASHSDFTQSANIAISSDYVYRGVSQTNSSLAIQGGFDVAHNSGLSAGVWASNVALGNSSEIDLYASYSLAISKDVTAAIGYKHYVYDGVSALNTGEINASVSAYGLTGTINWALTDYFGALNSDGTAYYDLSYTYAIKDLNNLALTLHYGWTVGDGAQADYQDYSVGLSYPISGYTLAVVWTSCNNDGKALYGNAAAGSATTFSVSRKF
jgi:uncharacterized protein (TIGR02001 family)